MKRLRGKKVNWMRNAAMCLAVCYMLIPQVVLAHHGEVVDTDGDGISNMTDVCWQNRDHYACLTSAGLWEWPARELYGNVKKKFNSIGTCSDLRAYVDVLDTQANRQPTDNLSAAENMRWEGAADNADSVFDNLCGSRNS